MQFNGKINKDYFEDQLGITCRYKRIYVNAILITSYVIVLLSKNNLYFYDICDSIFYFHAFLLFIFIHKMLQFKDFITAFKFYLYWRRIQARLHS